MSFMDSKQPLKLFILSFQQQQRPDLARLMQIHAQAQAGQLAPGLPAGLPPGLLGGHPGAPPASIPTTMSLLAGIQNSGTPSLAGPHPAFASLLAAQKPTPDPLAVAKSIDIDLKRAAADTNGGNILSLFLNTHNFSKNRYESFTMKLKIYMFLL